MHAPLTYVWIAKDKATAQFILDPVHLAPDDAEECLAIDQNFDAILFDRLIEHAGLVDIFKVVCEAATAPVPDPDPDELRIGLVQELP